MDEKASKFIEYLVRDDVDPRNSIEMEQLQIALFQSSGVRLHIVAGETIVKAIDTMVVCFSEENPIYQTKIQYYLTALTKLSLIFLNYSDFYIKQLIDEIKQVSDIETMLLIIQTMPDEIRPLLVKSLLQIDYWREAIPKLELYDTFL